MPDIEPKNREEIFLKNITRTLGGDDPVEIEPHNRQEHFLHNIAVALGADGVATELEPHNRLEYLYSEIAEAASGGGGNPNRVQTIEGDLSFPWTGLDYLGLLDAIINGDASIIEFEFDASALGYGKITNAIFPYYDGLVSSGCSGNASQLDSAFSLKWSGLGGFGSLVYGYVYDAGGQGTDLTGYASLIPTKITIIWHPLPN